MNNSFEYSNLEELLISNITNYIFSRKENLKAMETNKVQNLTIKAIKKFREIKNTNDDGNGGELGEMLLYIFLESNLRAYKLLSKMELKTSSNDYVKGADGIYLHEYQDKNENKHFEYIIGEAKIEATSSKAILHAFDSILTHLEKTNFDREIFKETFSEEDADRIKKIIVPSQENTDIDMQKAFGIFIGYGIEKSIDLNNVGNLEGEKLIKERLQKDIINISKNIQRKIEERKLKNYSFYVYIMPLKDAKKDRVEILNNILI